MRLKLNIKFNLVTEYLEETDFRQLVISLSDENENQLWYYYTVKGRNKMSLAYFYLNSNFGNNWITKFLESWACVIIEWSINDTKLLWLYKGV